MKDIFEQAHAFVAHWEGGLDDDPDDPGGITKYGVCIRFLKDLHRRNASFLGSIGIIGPITKETIRELTREQAKKIFRFEFWPDDFAAMSINHPRMAFAAYDTAVNMGMDYARKLVQRAVGTVADGKWGPKTRAAIVEASDLIGFDSMLEIRRSRYHEIAEKRPASKKFLRGWLNRANALEKAVEDI